MCIQESRVEYIVLVLVVLSGPYANQPKVQKRDGAIPTFRCTWYGDSTERSFWSFVCEL